jgi:hypothetical protein
MKAKAQKKKELCVSAGLFEIWLPTWARTLRKNNAFTRTQVNSEADVSPNMPPK